jgi:hypothetical protein
MKAKASPWLLIAAMALFLAGCATSRVNWDARLGNYTYDQAVLEMGPPDRAAKIGDGTIVAEWLTYRGSRGGYNFYTAPYFYTPMYDPPTPDRFLRLTFDSEGRLRDWRRVLR